MVGGEMNGAESGKTCITGLISYEKKNSKRRCLTSFQKYSLVFNFLFISPPPPGLHVIVFLTCSFFSSSLTKSVFYVPGRRDARSRDRHR